MTPFMLALLSQSRSMRGFSGLGIWLRGDAISRAVGAAGTDGSALATWNDLSNAGNSATQATSGLRPTYRRSGINGQPAVQFPGTAMMTTGYTPALTVGYTASTLFNFSGSHNGVLWGTASATSGASGDFLRILDNAGSPQLRIGSNGAFYDVNITTGTHLVTVINQSTSSASGLLLVRVDGVQMLSTTVTRSTTTNHPMYLGSLQTTAATQPFQGTIGDFAFMEAVRTTAEAVQIEAGIKDFYHLT